MKLTIQVTDSHIANGIRTSARCCPVALAILDAAVTAKMRRADVYVTPYEIDLWNTYDALVGPEHIATFVTPEQVQTLMTLYP